jgi:hypothetical protein
VTASGVVDEFQGGVNLALPAVGIEGEAIKGVDKGIA